MKNPEAGLVPRSLRVRRLGIPTLLLVAVVGATSPQAAVGAGPTCSVRNVTQDTSGRSLIDMVQRAVDGDELRVRGTCPGKVVIDVDLLIEGIGDAPTVTGRNRTRVFEVQEGARVTLRDITIQRGRVTQGNGGGVLNRGTLVVVNSIIRGNESVGDARKAHGGAIWNVGRLTLTGSTLADNRALFGGGIWNEFGGIARLLHVTIAGNATGLLGGGSTNTGIFIIKRSTVAGNRASGGGGDLDGWCRQDARDPNDRGGQRGRGRCRDVHRGRRRRSTGGVANPGQRG